jgi:predicted nucleotidyltransferase
MDAFKSDKSSVDCKPPAISSATAVRRAINSSKADGSNCLKDIEASVPKNVYELLKEEYLKSYPITEEAFAQILKYKLLAEDKKTLSEYMYIAGDLADRMKNISDLNMSIEELAGKIKTKNMTLTRINRALIHLLLNIRTDAVSEYVSGGGVPYARVLGIKKEASPLLRKIEKERQLPIITKVSKAEKQLDDVGMRMLSGDIFAAHLYNQAVYEKYRTVTQNEYKHGIIIEQEKK